MYDECHIFRQYSRGCVEVYGIGRWKVLQEQKLRFFCLLSIYRPMCTWYRLKYGINIEHPLVQRSCHLWRTGNYLCVALKKLLIH